MFQKAFKVKSSSAIKGSDRKRLKGLVEERFRSLSSDDVNALMPSKGEVSVTKLHTHSGVLVSVIILHGNPVFFEVEGEIYPTLYTLWKHPDMLPTMTTHRQVLSKLKGGADLMLPGVVLRHGPSYGINSFGRLAKGDPCAVDLTDNHAAVAVGKTALSSREMYESAKRGKGVIVLHTYEDQLWEMGDRTAIPNLGPPFVVRGGCKDERTNRSASEDNHSLDGVTDRLQSVATIDESPSKEEENVEVLSALKPNLDSMDELLYYCFVKALRGSAKNVEYPILVSTFYGAHLLPGVPSGRSLELKKTSYKKLTKFLEFVQEKGMIEVKELTKGVESIVAVNMKHPEIRRFEVVDEDVGNGEEESSGVGGGGGGSGRRYTKPEIEELFLVSASVAPLFKLFGHGKSTPLSSPQVRELLTKYVKDNNLNQQSQVTLDPILTDVLLSKQEYHSVTHLDWGQMLSRCLNKMSPGCKITFPGKVPIIRRGNLEPIELSVAKRAANKKVTLVVNLEVFGIDPSEFAHTIQVGVAASTSISPAPNRKEGSQVLVQGNQVAFVSKLLLEDYKVPRKYIKGLELAVKKKKN